MAPITEKVNNRVLFAQLATPWKLSAPASTLSFTLSTVDIPFIPRLPEAFRS